MARATEPTVKNEVPYSPSYPHSWPKLVPDPPGTVGPGGIKVTYGVLRPDHRGHAVSAAAFARAKLVVPARPDPTDWVATAHRSEVLLPAFADERLLDPKVLFEEVDATLPPGGRALAAYVTLSWMPERLHAAFELGRTLARGLVDTFETPALCVQHVPGANAGTNLPHLHLLIVARRLMSYGRFGPPIADLGRESGRQIIIDRLARLVGDTAS